MPVLGALTGPAQPPSGRSGSPGLGWVTPSASAESVRGRRTCLRADPRAITQRREYCAGYLRSEARTNGIPRSVRLDTQHVRDPRICVAPTVEGFLPDVDRYRHIPVCCTATQNWPRRRVVSGSPG